MPVIQNVRMHSNFLWSPQVTIDQDVAKAEPVLLPRKPGVQVGGALRSQLSEVLGEALCDLGLLRTSADLGL